MSSMRGPSGDHPGRYGAFFGGPYDFVCGKVVNDYDDINDITYYVDIDIDIYIYIYIHKCTYIYILYNYRLYIYIYKYMSYVSLNLR